MIAANDPLQYERFVQLFARVRDNLFAYIFTLLPHWSDAEDVFQQTSLVLWRKFGEFRAARATSWPGLAAWPFSRCATSGGWRAAIGCDSATPCWRNWPKQRVISPENANRRREFLLDCIAKLSDDQRALLLRTYEDEKTHPAIGRRAPPGAADPLQPPEPDPPHAVRVR